MIRYNNKKMFLCLLITTVFLNISLYSMEAISSSTNISKKDDHLDVSVKKLANSVLPKVTFSKYQIKNHVSSDVATWKNRLQNIQKKYNVSLVGININSWLENPEYFNTLQEIADKFSIDNLLDNLQSYNPNLDFNNPALVKKILETDIYTPYLKNVKNHHIKNQFSDVKRTISFTRNLHIYGVGANGYPYFGRPVEGGKREINLGMVNNQLSEIITKLPDTDIFLVAMINVVPNWLEEGLDVFQVNQQLLEIVIYAFDRNKKLIGGAGVPLKFWYQGQKFIFDQYIKSKIWQPSLSREFYILPSYKIVNTPVAGAQEKQPNITLPNDNVPVLTRYQKYILKALRYLEFNNRSIDIELFDDQGKPNFKPKRVSYPKVELQKKILVHKNSTLLVHNKEELCREDLLVRLQNQDNEKIPMSARSILLKKRKPSNEGQKLTVIFNQAKESLLSQPITYTNEEYNFTNDVLPFETELDPVIYHQKRKEYYILPNIIKAEKKIFNKTTKLLLKEQKIVAADSIFWYKNAFEIIKGSDQLTNAFNEWKEKYEVKTSIENELFLLDRKKQFIVESLKKYTNYLDRNMADLRNRYASKYDKFSLHAEKLTNRSIILSNKLYNSVYDQKFIDKYDELKNQYNVYREEESTKLKTLLQLFKAEYQTKNTIVSKFPDIANKYYLDNSLVNDIMKTYKISPIEKYQKRKMDRQEYKEWKTTRTLYYEGFILGITSDWSIKTSLEDRLDYL